MAERLAFGFAPNMNDNILYHSLATGPQHSMARTPPFPLINSYPFGSARSGQSKSNPNPTGFPPALARLKVIE